MQTSFQTRAEHVDNCMVTLLPCMQGAMTMSEAMNIPGAPQNFGMSGIRGPSSGHMQMAPGIRRQPTGTTPRMGGWTGPTWPAAGTSMGRYTPLGTSPFVDMVEVVGQLMDGEPLPCMCLHLTMHGHGSGACCLMTLHLAYIRCPNMCYSLHQT